ncbi:MAG: hypothetical protein IPI90_17735 [Saprospiraceae bacterium]|nr:hypothetical protein [Candidatus Vicinibacter affinis]
MKVDRYLEDHLTVKPHRKARLRYFWGNKTDRIATVNANILADLKKNKSGNMAVFAATESRGFEEEILAKVDTSIKKIYQAFKLAVQDKVFLRLPETRQMNISPNSTRWKFWHRFRAS